MLKRIFIITYLIFSMFNSSHAQYNIRDLYHEIGIYAGPVFLKSDFGARDDFENFYKNNGYIIGAVYFISADEDYFSLRDNFKLRLEASYMESTLNHYGKYVDGAIGDSEKQKLRAMSGKSSSTSAGFQVEFYPLKTDDYNRGGRISPYVSAGCMASLYTTAVTTSYGSGKIGNPSTTPTKYLDGYRNDVNQFTASLSGSIGTRYKLSEYHSLMAEVKLQYYFSDWVDGLNPNSRIYTENKTNDYLGSFNIGYIYYLDQN